MRLWYLLAWIVGGAIFFGLVVVLVIEPICSEQLSLELRQQQREEGKSQNGSQQKHVAYVRQQATVLLYLSKVQGEDAQPEDKPGRYQGDDRGWRRKFLCESTMGDFAIAYLIYCLVIVGAFRACGQANETRILHRAYVSVVPRGIEPFISGNGILSCDVAFYNGGNLPARNVRWFIDRKFSADGHLNDFPMASNFSGDNIILAKAEMTKGTKAIDTAELDSFKKGGGAKDRWLYVWGRVSYSDGFGQDRHTDSCFRYNMAGVKEGKIAAEAARQHEYGNRTDET